LDAEMVEQGGQSGVVQFVVDDEAGIYRDRRAVIVDRDRVAVTARAKLAVVDGDWIAFRQGPGRGIAGNSRSDNRDPHALPLFLLCSGDTAGRGVGFQTGKWRPEPGKTPMKCS